MTSCEDLTDDVTCDFLPIPHGLSLLVINMLLVAPYVLHYVVGKHCHIALKYTTQYFNAICCNANNIFLASKYPPGIHIYTWKGVHVQALSHQDLKIQRRDIIQEINCDADGTFVQMAVGRNNSTVNALLAYKVISRCQIKMCLGIIQMLTQSRKLGVCIEHNFLVCLLFTVTITISKSLWSLFSYQHTMHLSP